MKKKWVLIISALVVITVLIIAYVVIFSDLEPGKPNTNNSVNSIKGIDISHHNKVTNWIAVSDSVDFVILKATEGGTFKDPKFRAYWSNAKRHKVIRGAYHFFVPNVPAEKQFANFKNSVKLSKGDLVPFLDVEVKEVDVNEVNKWVALATAHYGVEPIIYTEYSFFKLILDGKVNCNKLWIYVDEKYGRKPSFKSYNCAFWQYSHTGNVKGIDGEVDLDEFIDTTNQISTYQMK
jgi:lysozyme